MSPKRQVSPRHCPWMVRLVPHPGSEPQQAGKGQVSPLSVPPNHSLHCMNEHGPCVGYLSPEPGGKHASRCRGCSTWSSVLLPVRAGSPWTIPHSTYQPPLGHTFPPDASHSAPSVPTWGTFLNFILNTHGHPNFTPQVLGACPPSPAATGWFLVCLRACWVCWSSPPRLWLTSDPGENLVSSLFDFLSGRVPVPGTA